MLPPYRSVCPTLHPSAFVDASAQVIGDVHYVRSGTRTNMQDLTLVHVMRDTNPTVIGDDVTVGDSAVVHGCTIGGTRITTCAIASTSRPSTPLHSLVVCRFRIITGPHRSHPTVQACAAGTPRRRGTQIALEGLL